MIASDQSFRDLPSRGPASVMVEITLDGLSWPACPLYHEYLARLAADDETVVWNAAAYVPASARVGPNLRAGDCVTFHQRPPTPPGADYRRCIVYGRGEPDGPELVLHAYARADRTETRPAVVLIHGGGWQGGHPSMLGRYAHDLACRGYVCAIVTYRRHPDVGWEGSLNDVKCAVRWLRSNARQLGADPERIGVLGNSAGGHLAAMVALTPGYFEGEGGHADVDSAVQAAALLYPITDMHVPGGRDEFAAGIKTMVGDDIELVKASPLTYVANAAAPVLTLAGETDELCSLSMLREFHDRLENQGADHELTVFTGLGHGFDFYPTHWPQVRDRLVDFFERVFDTQTRHP